MSRNYTLGSIGFHLINGSNPLHAEGRGERFSAVRISTVIDDIAHDSEFEIRHPKQRGIVRVGMTSGNGVDGVTSKVDCEI